MIAATENKLTPDEQLRENIAETLIYIGLIGHPHDRDPKREYALNQATRLIKLARIRTEADFQSELTRAREREKELVEALDNLASHAAIMRKRLAGANLPTGYADHEAIRDAERLVATSAPAGGKP